MAFRERTKKYDLSDLVYNFQLVDSSEDAFIDDNDSDSESYFSDSEFENDTNTVPYLQSATTANTSHDSVSLLAILVIFQLPMQLAMRARWKCLEAMMNLKLHEHPISLTTTGNL